MKIIAIANQKGGVGKTATAAALGDLLAQHGRRVLLLDLDPQSSLTQGLGIEARGASLAEVIGGAKRGPLTMQQIIKPLGDRLDIAPADIALAGCELGMIERLGRENIVKGLLRDLQGYDVVIIDCPPRPGLADCKRADCGAWGDCANLARSCGPARRAAIYGHIESIAQRWIKSIA